MTIIGYTPNIYLDIVRSDDIFSGCSLLLHTLMYIKTGEQQFTKEQTRECMLIIYKEGERTEKNEKWND